MRKQLVTSLTAPAFRLGLAMLLGIALPSNTHAASLLWGSGAAGGTGTWDVNTTLNWFDGGSDAVWPAAPGSGDDDAVFDGTPGTVTIGAGGVVANDITFNVNGYLVTGDTLTLDGSLNKPILMTLPATTNTISAVIAGTNGFNKYDNGMLILTGNNTFWGNVSVGLEAGGGPASGVLRITDSGALGVLGDNVQIDGETNQIVFIRSDGTRLELDGSGGDITLPEHMVFVTSGPNGVIRNVAGSNTINGEILLSTGVSDSAIISDGGSLTLAGPVHAGGSSRILRLNGNNSALNTVSGVISNGTGSAVTRVWKRSGGNTWMFTGANSYSDGTFIGLNLTATPYVNDGVIRLANDAAAGTGALTIYGGYQAGRIELAGDITVTNAISFYGRQGPTYPAIRNHSGTNTLTGNINVIANGSRLNFETAAGLLTISGNPMTGSSGRALTLRGAGTGNFAKDITSVVVGSLDKYDGGTWVLSGANSYTGNTAISAGTLSITGTSGASPINNTGGTLTGTGTINGLVTIGTGGTLIPGVSTNLGETLTINNDLALAGTVRVQAGKSGSTPVNDSVVGVTNITYGGTLIVANATGATFADGDAFVLFSASGTVTGNFTNILVDPPAANLEASFNPASGTLTFTDVVVAPPTLTYTNLGGGVIEFSFDGNSKLVWQTNTLAVGLGTDWMDYPDTSNPVQVTNDLSIPVSFFGLAPK